MASATFSAKVELAKIPNRKVFWKEIEKQMRKEGQQYKKLYHDWVDTWEAKPRFKVKIRHKTQQGYMWGEVTPTADQGLLQIMNWVIHGTGSHVGKGYYPIRPHGDYPLRYRETYTPATQPGIIQSRVPSYSGPEVTRNEVWHPGIEPRKITEFILLRREAAYINAMGEAVKRGLIASMRAGRT